MNFFLVIFSGAPVVGSMHQCAVMHLSHCCCSLRRAPANPNVALRNARSLPSCLEVNFGYKLCKRDDAAKGIFGDERPPSPRAGFSYDSTSLCFCDDKATGSQRKKNTRDGPRAATRQGVNCVWGKKAINGLKSIEISVRS